MERTVFIPLVCLYRNNLDFSAVILSLEKKGRFSTSPLGGASGEGWLVRSAEGWAALRYRDGILEVRAESDRSLRYVLSLIFRELAGLCKSDPELVLVLLDGNALPLGGSRVASFLARGGLGGLAFLAALIGVGAPLSLLGAPAALSLVIALTVSTLLTLLVAPAVAVLGLPRWELPPGERLVLVRARLTSLNKDLQIAALFAKLAIAKGLSKLTPEAVKRVLVDWGVPVRDVVIRELVNPASYLSAGRTEHLRVYVTPVRGLTAISYKGFVGHSRVVLGVETLIDLSIDEVLAVTAHELSHIEHNDSLIRAAVVAAAGFLLLAAASLLTTHFAALLAAFLGVAYAVVLCWRALEVRADLEAAAKVGSAPLKRALLKLEYPSLAESTTPLGRLVSLVLAGLHPPPWLRLAAIDAAGARGSPLRKALAANVRAPLLALSRGFPLSAAR